jgi:serine/threonine protein kinase
MHAPSSIQEFVELVRRSAVVPHERLDAFFRRQRGRAKQWTRPAQLAEALLQDGLLSKFHAKNLLLGHWRGFWINRCLVLEDLGSGGMGHVFLCEQTPMQRLVAVKVLPSTTTPGSMERFFREARASAALDHPNLVRAFDVDRDGRFHFLVLEYVDGSTLLRLVKEFGRLDVARACHYTAQAALGLHHAHGAGWIHRDVKPANLLVDRGGTVKVFDLGLARFTLGPDEQLTKQFDDQNLLGTADYIAPEQTLNDHTVDCRADVYSLGATLYFLLAGRPPYYDGNIIHKLMAHRLSKPRRLTQVRSDVPQALAVVVERMMAKNPAQRFQTAEEVCEALQPFLDGGPFRPPSGELHQHCPRVRLLTESGKAHAQAIPPRAPGSSGSFASSGVVPASAVMGSSGVYPASGSTESFGGPGSAVGLSSPHSPLWSRRRLVAVIALLAILPLLAVSLILVVGWWLFLSRPAGDLAGPGPGPIGAYHANKADKDQPHDYLTPDEAAEKVNQRCTVRFVVRRAALSKSQKTLFLNSESNYRADNNFTVLVHGVDGGPAKDRNELLASYQGKAVQVTGLVTLYESRPQIVASELAQIKIVNQPN